MAAEPVVYVGLRGQDDLFHRRGCPAMDGRLLAALPHHQIGEAALWPCPVCAPRPDPERDRRDHRTSATHGFGAQHPAPRSATSAVTAETLLRLDAETEPKTSGSPRPATLIPAPGSPDAPPVHLNPAHPATSRPSAAEVLRGPATSGPDGLAHPRVQDSGVRPEEEELAARQAAHDALLDAARARLAALGKDAARVRTALEAIGVQAAPADVSAWLTARGIDIAPNSLRAHLSRAKTKQLAEQAEQAKQAAKVIPWQTRA